METIRIKNIEDGIVTVMLSRPERKNAMSVQMMDDIIEAGETLIAREDIRAVILNGAGDSFCAGIDLDDLMKFAGNLDLAKEMMATALGDHGANKFQRPTTIWRDLRVPVIAALSGNCLGAGAQLALGADIRIAKDDLSFSIMEAKWGLIPDMGISQSLPRLIPADRALALIMTGTKLDAQRALNYGLVTEVCSDPYARAMELAREIVTMSPDAVAASKQMVNALWFNPKDGLKLEATLQQSLIGKPNQIEKTMASMQKRPPNFDT